MNTAYLSIGTNLGNRLENIKTAYNLLGNYVGIIKKSSVYETLPQEMNVSAPKFLNSVIKINTDKTPEELLQIIKEIETKQGRKNKNQKKSRIIDIDIILFNDLILTSEELVIPHPRMLYRDFVVYPLLEIEPEIIYPLGNIKLKDCIQSLTPKNIVKYADSNFNLLPISEDFKRSNC